MTCPKINIFIPEKKTDSEIYTKSQTLESKNTEQFYLSEPQKNLIRRRNPKYSQDITRFVLSVYTEIKPIL